MNGYGDFLAPLRWFQLYWGAASVVLPRRGEPAVGARHRRVMEDAIAHGPIPA
jgi:hypothetical protein